MSDLKNLADVCGKTDPPGTEVDFYYTCSCELADWPQTAKELASPGTAPGDSVRLGEAFDFTGAPTGEGYWRKATALVDKGGINMGVEGEVGAQALFSGARWYLKGTDAIKAEFAKDLTNASGCLIVMLKPRESADFAVCGTKAVPAVVESIEFDSGEKVGDLNGSAYKLRANTNLHYYAETLGVDVTPN